MRDLGDKHVTDGVLQISPYVDMTGNEHYWERVPKQPFRMYL